VGHTGRKKESEPGRKCGQAKEWSERSGSAAADEKKTSSMTDLLKRVITEAHTHTRRREERALAHAQSSKAEAEPKLKPKFSTKPRYEPHLTLNFAATGSVSMLLLCCLCRLCCCCLDTIVFSCKCPHCCWCRCRRCYCFLCNDCDIEHSEKKNQEDISLFYNISLCQISIFANKFNKSILV